MIRTSMVVGFFLITGALKAQKDSLSIKDSVRNEIGVTRLQSFYDSGASSSSVTSLEYIRRFESKSTLIGRVNYADRNAVNGLQVEAETYLMHSPKYYSFASVSVGAKGAFPEFKAGYSLNRNFKKGWEGELGYRFLTAQGYDVHSAVLGVGKYVGNYWLNLKGYLIKDSENYHHSYRFTSRYYLNDELDYLTLILATGTSPDDRSRNFDASNFGSFLSKSIAVGYKKKFKRNLSASFTGAWNNQKISATNYLNQFDLYISLSKGF
ncbi:YaiO family outer membrane beta-barrel protein [Chryseobacterium sp. A301]